MKLALAAVVLVACDAQVDGTYAGEPVARLHGTAVGFSPGDVADGAACRWNTQIGSDLDAGPVDPMPLETQPPSGLTVLVLGPPSDEDMFGFAGEDTKIAEGTLLLANGNRFVGEAIDIPLVFVDGDIAAGSMAARYLGGTPAPGFHIYDRRATAELTDAQAYFATLCGTDAACRTSRLYQLLPATQDLDTELRFFRATP